MISLQQLQREIQGLKAEKSDAVARVISAQQEAALANMLTGLSQDDSTDETLASLRDSIGQVEAKARIANELAGTDAAVAASEYEQLAANSQADEQFASLIFGDQTKAETATPEAEAPSRLGN